MSMDNMDKAQISLRGAAIPIAVNLALFFGILTAIFGPPSA
jgi:hypothetical protein